MDRDETLREQEPGRELEVAARGAHRDRDPLRVLAGALRADLEGLLGGERVRPFRPRVSVHRDDPHGRDVATNLLGGGHTLQYAAPREA